MDMYGLKILNNLKIINNLKIRGQTWANILNKYVLSIRL